MNEENENDMATRKWAKEILSADTELMKPELVNAAKALLGPPSSVEADLETALYIGLAALGHFNTYQTDKHWNDRERTLREIEKRMRTAKAMCRQCFHPEHHAYTYGAICSVWTDGEVCRCPSMPAYHDLEADAKDYHAAKSMPAVTDADVEAVERAVGMGHAAWDTVDPKAIIAAARGELIGKVIVRNGIVRDSTGPFSELPDGIYEFRRAVGVDQ